MSRSGGGAGESFRRHGKNSTCGRCGRGNGAVAAGATSRPHWRRRLRLAVSRSDEGRSVTFSAPELMFPISQGRGANRQVVQELQELTDRTVDVGSLRQ